VILGHVRRLVEAGRLWVWSPEMESVVGPDAIWHERVGAELAGLTPMALPGALRSILQRWAANTVGFRPRDDDPPCLVAVLAPAQPGDMV
jgi:hypothetical protein